MIKVIQKGTIKSSGLVILGLACVLFPRILSAIGLPTAINFLHFAFIPLLFLIMFEKIKGHIALDFLKGILTLLCMIILSAIVNGAGVINIILDFLLLVEPFLFLIAIIGIRWNQSSIRKAENWIFAFIAIHVFFVYFQWLVLGHTNDGVQGIFLGMGAGCHLAGAVGLIGAIYYYSESPTRSRLLRIILTILCCLTVLITDAKQVIAVLLLSLILLTLTKLFRMKDALKYIVILTLTVGSVAAMISVAATYFPRLLSWSKSSLILLGFEQKFSVFPIIISYYHSGFNWLFGIGPGHSVSRLGWMYPDYARYLSSLGGTMSPATDFVWQSQQNSWFSNSDTGSSMFSLFFTWSGIWGDLGLLGLGSYLHLWYLTWKHLCVDDIQKLFIISIVVFGGVFTWMEEPGYMLFMISLIGVKWQKYQSSLDRKQLLAAEEDVA